jgi:hypothetical protein
LVALDAAVPSWHRESFSMLTLEVNMIEDLSVRLKLGDKGKLSIPVAIREGAGLEVGEVLSLTILEPGVIQLSSVRLDVGALQGKYAGGEL